MSGLSRQVTNFDWSTFIAIVWFLVFIGVVYWLYRTMKRIEQTLSEIKKSLEGKT